MLPTCRDMSATTRRVAPILVRWVRVADTKLFVSARANIYQIFRSAYVEIYYGMGVHMHRYYRTSQRSFLSCSPFCHVLHMKQKITTTLLNTTVNTTAQRLPWPSGRLSALRNEGLGFETSAWRT
jgi:hypothetical protein